MVKSKFNFVNEILNQIKNTYEKDIKNQSKFSPHKFKSLINICLGNLSSYRYEIILSIKNVLINDVKYKKKLDNLINLFAIELKSYGYSSDYIRNSINIFFTEDGCNFFEKFNKFLSYFSCEDAEYECIFHVNWPGEKIELNEHNIIITDSKKEKISSAEEKEFYDLGQKATIAKIKINAPEEFTAFHKAKERLGSILSVSKLFNLNKAPSIRKTTVLIKLPDGKSMLYDENQEQLFTRDALNSSKKVIELVDLIKKLDKSDGDQILASLQYHQISQTASTDESKIVNLWIALESLIQDGGTSIIDRMCNYIPYSNSTVYCSQMMRAVPYSLKLYWRCNNTSELRKNLNKSDCFNLSSFDLTKIVTDKKMVFL